MFAMASQRRDLGLIALINDVKHDLLPFAYQQATRPENDPDIGDSADFKRPGNRSVQHVSAENLDNESSKHQRERRCCYSLGQNSPAREELCLHPGSSARGINAVKQARWPGLRKLRIQEFVENLGAEGSHVRCRYGIAILLEERLAVCFGGKHAIIVQLLGCIFGSENCGSLFIAERIPEWLCNREEDVCHLMSGENDLFGDLIELGRDCVR